MLRACELPTNCGVSTDSGFSLVLGWIGHSNSSLSDSPTVPKTSIDSLLFLKPNGGHRVCGSGACEDISKWEW